MIEYKSENYQAFADDLVSLINRHGMEKFSDTPDHVLALYLTSCLIAFGNALRKREELSK